MHTQCLAPKVHILFLKYELFNTWINEANKETEMVPFSGKQTSLSFCVKNMFVYPSDYLNILFRIHNNSLQNTFNFYCTWHLYHLLYHLNINFFALLLKSEYTNIFPDAKDQLHFFSLLSSPFSFHFSYGSGVWWEGTGIQARAFALRYIPKPFLLF